MKIASNCGTFSSANCGIYSSANCETFNCVNEEIINLWEDPLFAEIELGGDAVPGEKIKDATDGRIPPAGRASFSASAPTPMPVSTQIPTAQLVEKRVASVPIPTGGQAVPAPQAIPVRAYDPLRARFRDMRRIADYAPYSYQNDGWLFYEQARFMADVSDDYPHRTAFSAFYPFYQRMGYEQLRTYFTWRTRVRGGEFPFVGASYLFLYIYELLSCIGTDGPQSALEKLESLHQPYREAVPALDQYLPGWERDFHIYYGVKTSVAGKETKMTNSEESAAFWIKNSAYDIKKSKFITTDNEKMVTNCVAAVFGSLREWFASQGTSIEEVILQDDRPKVEFWKPFSQALFYPWLKQTDRRVPMPGGETYVCQNNRWTVERAAPFAGTRELVGHILRITEARLRVLNGHKRKLTADAQTLVHATKKLAKAGLHITELEAVTEQTVAAFHRELHRIDVKVDATRLTQIRTEAYHTQEKLTVEEITVKNDLSVVEEITAENVLLTVEENTAPPATGTEAFIAALTNAERAALVLLCSENTENTQAALYALADKHHTMPEVLAEGINEKAVDFIGDQILDTDSGVTVYADYAADFRKIKLQTSGI